MCSHRVENSRHIVTGLSDDANENRDDVVLDLPPRSQYTPIVIMQSHLGGLKPNFVNLAIPS